MAHLGIKTGDHVIVLRGKDAGKKGKVMQVFPKQRKVVIDGANGMTKNVRARKAGDKGQRVQFFAPVDRSNVMLIDGNTGKPTRHRSDATAKVIPPAPATAQPVQSPSKK